MSAMLHSVLVLHKMTSLKFVHNILDFHVRRHYNTKKPTKDYCGNVIENRKNSENFLTLSPTPVFFIHYCLV